MNDEIVRPLRQRHVEAFTRDLTEAGIDPTDPFGRSKDGDEPMTLAGRIQRIGAINRTAAAAGMLNGTDPDDLEPWRAAQLSAAVLGAVWESFVVPKASTSTPPPTPADSESVLPS